METRGKQQVITARVPMAEMFGYATDLRSTTQGRGVHSMHFDRYELVPKKVGDDLVARMTGITGS